MIRYEIQYWDEEESNWEFYPLDGIPEIDENDLDQMQKAFDEAITKDRKYDGNKDITLYQLIKIEETLIRKKVFDVASTDRTNL